MGYKRKLFNDKTIVAAAAVGVLAISAIVGGVMLGGSDEDNKAIVDLDEGSENNTFAEKETGHIVSDDKNIIAENVDNKTTADDNSSDTDNSGNNSNGASKTQGTTAKDDIGTDVADKDNSSDKSENEDADNASADRQGEDAENVNVTDGILGLHFTPQSTLIWPVEGNVIIDYDMENTVYFATLDLYKCSDAVCIQSSVGTPVYAGSQCSVENVEYDSEIGNNVTVSLGNGYMLTYGQLKDVQVASGDIIEEGDLIGYVGNPTKYYTVEGAHLYMKMTHDGQAIDPLDYLNYDAE